MRGSWRTVLLWSLWFRRRREPSLSRTASRLFPGAGVRRRHADRHGRLPSGVRLGSAMPATPAWPPRSLPRLYVATPLGAGASVELDGAQANYLGNVMRLRQGDQLLVFDGMSGEWLAEIAEAGKRRM